MVQAFFGSRYMGGMRFEFDAAGDVVSFERKAVIVADAGSAVAGATFFDTGADPQTDADPSKAYLPDPSMQELVDLLVAPLNEFINTPVSDLIINLDDSVDGVRRIRTQEMPLGNVACDAMMDNVNRNSPGTAQICMQNGGGIRAPLEIGEVTFGQVITVFPFANVVSILKMDGARIHAAIEHGLSRVGLDEGAFLHFGEGFQLRYDPLADVGARINSITIDGTFILNDTSQEFNVVTNSFIATGGDGFGEIMTGAEVVLASGEPQEDAFAQYLQSNPNLCEEIEGRIIPSQNPQDELGNEIPVLETEFEDCSQTFTLLHINDMHARVQGMRGTGGCSTEQNNAAECDGGWGRLLAAGKQFVDESSNPVIFVDNGDEFAGTAWSTFYKGEETYTFLNQMCESRANGGAGFEHCFSGLGNHEFDFGYFTLLNFARNLNHDIVSTNIDDVCSQNSQDGTHQAGELGSLFSRNKVVTIGKKKVAFVGYTTPETPGISSPPDCMSFRDEGLAIGPEIQALKENGVDVIVVIGHSGITRDLEIAENFPDVDLIIGGHSHTFLWNEDEQGPIPAQSRPDLSDDGELEGLRKDSLRGEEDVYPNFVARDDTPVLQAFFGSRYLGAVEVTFDKNGDLVDLKRKSVLLGNENSIVAGATTFNASATPKTDADASKAFTEDEDMMALVNVLLAPLEEFIRTPVGVASVVLDDSVGGSGGVRTQEMPLGNAICDAMLANINSKEEGEADFCMQNGGGIRASIQEGQVSFGEVIAVLPFSNVLSVLEFEGERIYQAVEHGLGRVGEGFGEFLHFSAGVEMYYDPTNEPGARVINISLNGELIQNDTSRTYIVVTNSFLASGGDNFGEIMSEANVVLASGDPQEDAFSVFLEANCPSCFEIDGRINPVVNPTDSLGNEIPVLETVFPDCSVITDTECDLTLPTSAPTESEEEEESDDDGKTGAQVFGLTFLAFVVIALSCAFLLEGTKKAAAKEEEEKGIDAKVDEETASQGLEVKVDVADGDIETQKETL